MRAVWLQPNQEYLAERHRLGWDKKDELWDGVLHMVPPPSYHHVKVSIRLFKALSVVAGKRGLDANPDGPGLFEAGTDNYRIPDGSVSRPEHAVSRGIEGAELVIEVLSPDDDSYNKFDFYAKLGVGEVWIVDPHTLVVEVYALTGGAYVRVPATGAITISPLLGISLELDAGPSLRLRDGDDVHDV
ncbi:MAG TPA: Uma2 family endonuclease [Kofleriaceae bacterium]|jgi:Uma2 family endonuclease|nr:Uma2 family endonuclease [Kofleriaceae bacterium]